MAEISGNLRNGLWYKCSDGTLIEPLDIIALLVPNEGRDSITDNACFTQRHFHFLPLRELLPPASKYFAPDDLIDSVMVLILFSILITISMVISKEVWCRLDPQFAAINPTHKQWYVVANLHKSFFLACLATSSRYWVGAYRGFYLDAFQVLEAKRCAIVYCVTDFVALYMVPKLPRSTILHHIATVLLCVTVSGSNITVKGWGGLLGVCKMCLLYGTFSALSYAVNTYLALRVVYPKATWLSALAKLSLWTYLLCCAGNWTIHALWLIGLFLNWDISISTLLYMVAISLMVHDDTVLIRWLIKRSSPMATDENDKKEE